MVFLVGALLGRSLQSPSIVLVKSRKCINNVILRPDRSEIMLEAEYCAVYSINQSISFKELGSVHFQTISLQFSQTSFKLSDTITKCFRSFRVHLIRKSPFLLYQAYLILVLLPLPYLCGWQFIFLDLDGFTYSEIPFFRPSLILGTNLLTLTLPFGKKIWKTSCFGISSL